MAIQRSQGQPRPQVSRPDELPDGLPGPARRAPKGNHGDRGKLVPGPDTSALAAAGGRARAEALRVERLLGRVELPEDHPVAPYRKDAADWRTAALARLAETAGGGQVGPAVQAIVSTAALQHAASRWLFDRAALDQSPKAALAASRLADASRQNMLAAWELAAREADALRKTTAADPNRWLRPKSGDRA